MTIIESQPDELTGDVVVGSWQLHGFHMRAELTWSSERSVPGWVTVYFRNPLAGLKWPVCTARCTHITFEVTFCKPYDGSDRSYSDLWRETVRAKLLSEYIKYGLRVSQEVSC